MSHRPIISQAFKQSQKLIVNYAMEQAFAVLEMPSLELSDWLEGEIEKNPILEIEYPSSKENFYHTPSNELTLYQYLLKEILWTFEDLEERSLAHYIAGCLDETGFLTLPHEEICTLREISPEFFNCVLEKFQKIIPIGMGAKNAKECLLIQLKIQKKEHTLIYKIIDESYDNFIQKRFPLIAKKFHCKTEEIQYLIQKEISSLTPFPGLQFTKSHNPFVIPDLYIEKEEDIWKVELMDQSFPSFHINPFYLDHMEKNGSLKQEITFIKRFLSSGKWLSSILENRKKILLDIGAYLVKHQQAFLEGTSCSPSPMTMKSMAEMLGYTPSTITRAIANKYLSAPRGIIRLRALFTKALKTKAEQVSQQKAKNLLIKMIASEDKKKPLSDQALCDYLTKEGIVCARRTVTKYRNELKIGSSSQRREYFL